MHSLLQKAALIALVFVVGLSLERFLYESHFYRQRIGDSSTKEKSLTVSPNLFVTLTTAPNSERERILEVWHQYVQEHSQAALEKECLTSVVTDGNINGTAVQRHSCPHRKFAVGFYSCPLQAGNRVHHFLNSLIWAVVTNRTLLWKYYDKASCESSGKGHSRQICHAANLEQDCSATLERASWIPSFDEWSRVLQFREVPVVPITIMKGLVSTDSSQSVDAIESQVIEFAQLLGQDADVLSIHRKRNDLLATNTSKERAEKLVPRMFIDFLYGMLFNECFSFQPSIVETEPMWWNGQNDNGKAINNSLTSSSAGWSRDREMAMQRYGSRKYRPNPTTSITVIVHSRHSDPHDIGSDIRKEMKCLKKIIPHGTQDGPVETQSSSQTCTVILLSDRTETLKAIPKFLSKSRPHCLVMRAWHDKANISFSVEHGPFAGAGFYQDLALVEKLVRQAVLTPQQTNSTVAFVGFKGRSSSQLIRELVSYEFTRLQWNISSDPSSGDILTCYYP